jgi:hypothetical protein
MIIIYLLAIYAITFAIKEIDGPWGIISWFKNQLMQNKYVGVFFYKLFSCYFCLGFHAGWMIYLLSQDHYKFNLIILWGLAGAASSLILDTLVTKLSRLD